MIRKLAIDIAILAIVLVAIYGIVLYVTPNWGRSLFSGLTPQPTTELRYLTHTETIYVKVPIVDEVTSPADSVITDEETGDKIAYDRWDVNYEYLKGYLDVEYRYKEETFVYKPTWESIHKETTHYITEQIVTTLPPRALSYQIGSGLFWGKEDRDFLLYGGINIYQRFGVSVGGLSSEKVGVIGNFTF